MTKLTKEKVTTTLEINREQVHAGDIILFNVPTELTYYDLKMDTTEHITKAIPAMVLQTWSDRIDVMPVGTNHMKTIMADQIKPSKVYLALTKQELEDRALEMGLGE